MRIVAGTFKGHAIAGPKSNAIRPTSDRLRETLFNILVHAYDDPIQDARVLDMFAGTGALGLEALSRGAAYCLFVEEAAEARALIRENVETLSLSGITKLWRRDATRLGRCAPMEPFQVAFLDPPYDRGLTTPALGALVEGGWMVDGGLVLLEEAAKAQFIVPPSLELLETRDYGETSVHFYKYNYS